MKYLLTLALVAFSTISHAEVPSWVPQRLATVLSVESVQIVQAKSTSDLNLAAYNESAAVVAVVVGESSKDLFVYMEPSDLGGAVLRINKETKAIEMVHSAHTVQWQHILKTLNDHGAASLIDPDAE